MESGHPFYSVFMKVHRVFPFAWKSYLLCGKSFQRLCWYSGSQGISWSTLEAFHTFLVAWILNPQESSIRSLFSFSWLYLNTGLLDASYQIQRINYDLWVAYCRPWTLCVKVRQDHESFAQEIPSWWHIDHSVIRNRHLLQFFLWQSQSIQHPFQYHMNACTFSTHPQLRLRLSFQ